MLKEALLYEKLDNGAALCRLCAHQCRIPQAQRGICKTRVNVDGTLYFVGYGNLIACANDPIEKKPLFHFLPASQTLSIAAAGCNFSCRFCQNHTISQVAPDENNAILSFSPDSVVALAKFKGAHSISYTYTEPTVFFDFAFDTARVAAGMGLKNIFVTNGYLSVAAIATIAPYLAAANVDLKSSRDEFYQNYCGAHLSPVLECIRELKERGIWVEITTLLIEPLNNADEDIRAIAEFIANLDRDIPWHISRYFPHYRLQELPPTPLTAMARAIQIGKAAGLRFVYAGNTTHANLALANTENTLCPVCGAWLIERSGFFVSANHLTAAGTCPHCGFAIAGVWG